MRIGLYSYQYRSAGRARGGGNYASSLAGALVEAGHDVHVFTASLRGAPPDEVDGVRVHPIRVHDIPLTRGVQFRVRLPRVLYEVSRRSGGFDVLHSNIVFVIPGMPAPTVLTIHHVLASLHDEVRRRRLSGELRPLALRAESGAVTRADRIVTVSRRSRSDLARHYPAAASKAVAIPNGIDATRFEFDEAQLRRVRESLGIGPRTLLLVAVPGQVDDERKGMRYLMRALCALDEEIGWRCVVLGGGDSQMLRRELAGSPAAGRVEFPGFVAPDRKDRLIASCDLLVVPSLLEGCPIGVLEAFAAGRAVVASNVGGIPELLRSPSQGVLVPPRDVDALREAIVRLARDEDARIRAGLRNRRLAVEEMSWAAAARATEAVYAEALESRWAGLPRAR